MCLLNYIKFNVLQVWESLEGWSNWAWTKKSLST